MDSQNAINKIKEESDAQVGACLCPLGGDESNDCADCVYSGEYHFVDGECVARTDKHMDEEYDDCYECSSYEDDCYVCLECPMNPSNWDE